MGLYCQEGRTQEARGIRERRLGRCVLFVAVEHNTKLVINFTLGRRNQTTTDVFIEDLRDALEPNHPFQIKTDGFSPYVSAISTTLGHRVDFAQLIKIYGSPNEEEQRYSPATVESVQVVPVLVNPVQIASALRLWSGKT